MTPPVIPRTKIDDTIDFLEAGAEWAALLPVPGVAAISVISGKLLKLIQVAIKSHQAITGEPLDLSKLTDLPYV